MTEGYQPVNNGKMPAKPTTGSDAYKVNKVVIVPQEVIEELSKSMIKIIDEIDWNVLINKCLERPHGKWIKINPESRGYAEFFRCSNCLSNVQLSYWGKECEYDYCPNCGADMREADNDTN